MEFKVYGTKCTFTFSFFLALAISLLLDRSGMGSPALLAAGLHECGHLLLLRYSGGSVKSMLFCPFGIRMQKQGEFSYGREALIYSGGVLSNAAACLLLSGLFLFFSHNPGGYFPGAACVYFLRVLKRALLCNTALILFNLLPIGRLDGGQLLRLLLFRFLPLRTAGRLSFFIGLTFLVPLLFMGLLAVPQGGFVLLLTAGYLAVTLSRP